MILVHGLVRSYSRMLAAREALKKAGYENVFIFDYASTNIDIPTAAESLQKAVRSLEGIDKIHFVAHSMGGIVVRQWMAKHSDCRLGRLVMLGTPNQGAELSDRFRKYSAFSVVFGPAALQLATPTTSPAAVKQTAGSNPVVATPATVSFLAELPAPTCEFAIITGSGGGQGYNPLIPGDDDGIVSVTSTRLPGACDTMTFRCAHARLTRDPAVLECVVRFLKEGRLRKEGPLSPIPTTPANAEQPTLSPAGGTQTGPRN